MIESICNICYMVLVAILLNSPTIPYARFPMCINYFRWLAHLVHALYETYSKLAINA